MDLVKVQINAWEVAESKGFHNAHYYLHPWHHAAFTKLALITTEIAEATEVLRRVATVKELREGTWVEELADIVIRVADLAEDTGVNLDAAVRSKLESNKSRPHLHGKRA